MTTSTKLVQGDFCPETTGQKIKRAHATGTEGKTNLCLHYYHEQQKTINQLLIIVEELAESIKEQDGVIQSLVDALNEKTP